ncbi:MAG: hypothetical protein RI897_695 [Verrucomicrobiota bacterium]|jgi:Zn finger protein HypA/HybF involved in hydrogenase expression
MPEERSAIQKFACPSCGADARWTPAKQALICPYCGTESPAELADDGQSVKENDLATALRGLSPDERGWQADRKSVRCQSCNAISVFAPDRVAQNCDFCGSAAILPVTETAAPIKPQSQLPFTVSEVEVRELARKWYRTRWFAPNKLKNKALTDTVHGLYLPYWTFDANASADWTAQAGYHYWDTEHYTDSQGKRQTRRVRKTRWVPASGHLDHFFDDALVSGSRGVDPALLRQLEPWATKDLLPYDPGYLSGWVVEQYQIDLIAAAQRSREKMDAELRTLCARQVPGDTHRGLSVNARYSNQTFKHILLPVWLLTFNFGRKSYPLVANGTTGKLAGRYPKSWIKITLLVITIAAIAGTIVAFTR